MIPLRHFDRSEVVKSSALRLVGGKEKLFSEQVILLFHEGKAVTVRLWYKQSVSENVTQNRTAKSQMLLTAQIKQCSLDSPSPACSRFRFVRADALWTKSLPCCVQNADEACIHITHDSKMRQHRLMFCARTDRVILQQISDYNFKIKLVLKTSVPTNWRECCDFFTTYIYTASYIIIPYCTVVYTDITTVLYTQCTSFYVCHNMLYIAADRVVRGLR